MSERASTGHEHLDGVRVPPDAEISGHGLRLRPWRPRSAEDVDAWLRGQLDPEFRRWNTPLRTVATLDEARVSLCARRDDATQGLALPFCVTDAETGAVLGHVGLNAIEAVLRTARVGYWVLPEARGMRVAHRALTLVTAWAFRAAGLYRLDLGHAVGHHVSCRIAERCGYRYEGTMRGAMFEAGRKDAFRDVHLHARLATDAYPRVPDPREAPADA